jgi:hypothetical protein
MANSQGRVGPIVAAIIGIIAFIILVYMLINGVSWFFERIFNLGSQGTPIYAFLI